MASRWMAPKIAKLHRPYTDHELMIMGASHRPPHPDVLDAIADAKFWQGWDSPQHQLCEGCGQLRSANGTCAACEMYTPEPPRTLQQRQETRRLAVAVAVHTRHARPARKGGSGDRLSGAQRRKLRKLQTMGLR